MKLLTTVLGALASLLINAAQCVTQPEADPLSYGTMTLPETRTLLAGECRTMTSCYQESGRISPSYLFYKLADLDFRDQNDYIHYHDYSWVASYNHPNHSWQPQRRGWCDNDLHHQTFCDNGLYHVHGDSRTGRHSTISFARSWRARNGLG